MKILRLTLRNLASLAGTHTVDFEREPLRSTGLFSISGPTGSGKSTLLDALCVALYEDTPRLASANGTKLPDTGSTEVTQKDPGNLLRRGAGEGFSEVVFVGVDGQPYTARWSIRRARQRPDGALQPSEMVLFRGNVRNGEGPVECGGKKTEVLPAIAAKVGLSFEQFTRAVLLAQNDFAVFLKSDDKQRAEILQALTGTERFERISRAVFERNKAELEELQVLRAKAAGQLPLAPEARAAAEAELRRTADALVAARQQIAVREAHAGWFRRARELAASADAARTTLGSARQALVAAEPRRVALAEAEDVVRGARSLFDEERNALAHHAAMEKTLAAAQDAVAKAEQAVAAAGARHAMAEKTLTTAQKALGEAAAPLQLARALDAQLAPAAERRAEKRKERESAEAIAAEHRQRAAKLGAEIAERDGRRARAQVRRAALAALAPVVQDAAGWIERLKASLKAAADAAERERELQTKQAADTLARRHRDEVRAQLQQQTNAFAGCDQARAAAEAGCRNFDSESLAKERQTLQARIELLAQARAALEATEGLGRRRTEMETSLGALRQTGIALATAITDVAARLPAAEAAWKAKRDSRALAEATVEKHTLVLRERLRAGDPCPVCGAVDHPYAAHAPVVDTMLEALRTDEAHHESAVQALQTKKTELAAKSAANDEQVAAKARELAGLNGELAAAQKRLEPLLSQAGLSTVPTADQRSALLTAGNEAAHARQGLDDRDTAQRKAAKALEEARQLAERARAALTQAEKATAAADTDAAMAAAQLRSAQEAQARAAKVRADADSAVAGLFALLPDGAAGRFKASGDDFIENFGRDTADLRRLDEELANEGKRREGLLLQATEIGNALREAETLVKTRAEAEANARAAHEKLVAERGAVLGGRAASDVERALATAIERAKTDFDAATTTLGETTKTHAGATATVNSARSATGQAEHRCAAARTGVDAWLEHYAAEHNRRLDRAQLTEILSRPLTWLNDEREALARLDRAVSQAEGACATCNEAIAQHQAIRPTAEDEPVVLTALAAARETDVAAEKQQVAAAAVIAGDDRCRTEHAALLEAVAARQTRAEPWARLNDLIGSADGAKFRTIVQGRTLDLLLTYANAQLELLSSRYRLERLRPSLNLIVIDRDMADERRSVHSLSGGESFLVSLALALGLASLTSNRIRIESLFIDEGFGSLDQATLGTAMNALMHLEAQGRKVGVISHVTEMADAIPVQIRVVKGPAGASRLVVPGASDPHDVAAEAVALPPPDTTPTSHSGVGAAPAQVGAQLLDVLQAGGKPAGNDKRKRVRKKTTAEPAPAPPLVQDDLL